MDGAVLSIRHHYCYTAVLSVKKNCLVGIHCFCTGQHPACSHTCGVRHPQKPQTGLKTKLQPLYILTQQLIGMCIVFDRWKAAQVAQRSRAAFIELGHSSLNLVWFYFLFLFCLIQYISNVFTVLLKKCGSTVAPLVIVGHCILLIAAYSFKVGSYWPSSQSACEKLKLKLWLLSSCVTLSFHTQWHSCHQHEG